MERLTQFLHAAPTPWHAIEQMEKILMAHGFSRLAEDASWSLEPGGRYLVKRQPGAMIAFVMPRRGSGYDTTGRETKAHGAEGPFPIHLACTHSDSPCLKLKANPCKKKGEHLVLDVEVYGSPLLSTWFDRGLGLAGEITLAGPGGQLRHRLLDFGEPVAIVPSLAIHLNREAGDGGKIRRHDDLSPILLHPGFFGDRDPSAIFRSAILECLATRYPSEMFSQCVPVSWDLSLYDVAPPQTMGGGAGWITGGRLDNLLSCFAAVTALAESVTERDQRTGEPGGAEVLVPMFACFNHEECGSLSPTGAQGNFLPAVLGRILGYSEGFQRSMSRSLMVSIDNAHGVHPNFIDRHDGNNAPMLNAGVVFKHNANQRYAHSTIAEGRLKGLCRSLEIPWQEFAMRADLTCGSTIGPMLAAALGIHAIDLGIASWAMHSIRETAGLQDVADLRRLLRRFFASG
ncbi:MAG: M18 family aminopeptidase [Magnetococcales bacterium]|nr:M18 family aminopeptidase [Magnetococcales bacterium]